MTSSSLKGQFGYCMHGLGAIGGLRQTNTREAFERWYRRGVRIFEFDMACTDDGYYVAVAHTVDRPSMFRMEITQVPESYTREWFMKQRLFPRSTKGLTPLSLEDIVRLLANHEDCVFMLDLFGLFTKEKVAHFLAALEAVPETAQVADRLLLEAYNQEMSDAIAAHTPHREIIYCVRYEGNADGADVGTAYLAEKGIRFISYPWSYTEKHPGELQKYADAGLTVFSRTKYNTKNGKLQKAGVSVNIVGYRFHGAAAVVEWPLYMLACMKRLWVKVIMKFF